MAWRSFYGPGRARGRTGRAGFFSKSASCNLDAAVVLLRVVAVRKLQSGMCCLDHSPSGSPRCIHSTAAVNGLRFPDSYSDLFGALSTGAREVALVSSPAFRRVG